MLNKNNKVVLKHKNNKIKFKTPISNPIKEHEYPNIFTYEYNFTPYHDEDIIIPFYATDYYQREWMDNDFSLSFDFECEVDGDLKIEKKIKAGDTTVNIGKLSVGLHYISLQVTDRGVKSQKLYIEVLVKDRNYVNKVYEMTSSDLVAYKINNSNSDIEENMTNTRLGLTKLMNDKKVEGYDELKLVSGYYRINKYTDLEVENYLSVPSEFTLDMNGATIKHHVFVGQESNIIRLLNCFDSHVKNGILVGDYGEHDNSINPDTGYPWGEHARSIMIAGGKFCSISNMEVRDIQGYSLCTTMGKKTVNQHIPNASFTKGVNLIEGVSVTNEEYTTSDFVSLDKFINANQKWITSAGYPGMNFLKGDRWTIKFSFYDTDKNFICDIVGYQYRHIVRPSNAAYVRVTYHGDLGDDNSISIYYTDICSYSTYYRIKSINTRTCAMAPTSIQMLIKECTFENCATQTTPVTIDCEDGWGYMSDYYFIDNEIISNAPGTTANFIATYGNNYVFKNNKNFHLSLVRAMQRVHIEGVLKSAARGSYPNTLRAFSCYDTFKDGVIDSYSRSAESGLNRGRLKNCIINKSITMGMEDTVENCMLLGEFGSCYLKNCNIITTNVGYVKKFKAYKCNFINPEENRLLINFNDPVDTININECSFTGKWLAGGVYFHNALFDKCTFDDISFDTASVDHFKEVLVRDCNITCSSQQLLNLGSYAYSKSLNKVKFDNCSINLIGNYTDNYFVFGYAKPKGYIHFNNCVLTNNATSNSCYIYDTRRSYFENLEDYSIILEDTPKEENISYYPTELQQYFDEQKLKLVIIE